MSADPSIEPDFGFSAWGTIRSHSLVNIESSEMNEEYILLTGGLIFEDTYNENVYKFNGTWYHFGHLKRPRAYHSSIYWNGAIYVVGGRYSISYWDLCSDYMPYSYRSTYGM